VPPLGRHRRGWLHAVTMSACEASVHRGQLIALLRDRLLADPRVLACWLEGADANGTVDRFSDVDLCVAVVDGAISGIVMAAREALSVLGPLDIDHELEATPQRHHVVFHVAKGSPDLLVDFCLHANRPRPFVRGDPVEQPLVLFDRASVVQFVDSDVELARIDPVRELHDLRQQMAQHRRVLKHIWRGEFLEAAGYYMRWVIEPLIEVLRMLHTPLHPDYYIVHISRHLPPEDVARLERLFRVTCLADLEGNVSEAVAWFHEIAAVVVDRIEISAGAGDGS
jgi:hypothetical protein